MTEAAPLVAIERASVRKSGRLILDCIDFDLPAGAHTAVTGPNGAGKTTLLRLIAGIVWPAPGDGGSRCYSLGFGPELDALTARARIRLVGPELQDHFGRAHLRLSGRDIVATGFDDSPILRRRLTAAEWQRVDKCLRLVGARAVAARRFAALSRGEQRRVLLARALVSAPRVLCLDEFGDGLDRTARDSIRAVLARMATTGPTLVVATHRPEDLPASIGREIRLHEGRIDRTPALPEPVSGTAAVRVAATGPPVVSVERAQVYRDHQRVLADIDWQLPAGTQWLVHGPNGAGKSTFLKLLHAELRPAHGGRITFFGDPSLNNVWSIRQQIGLVSDELQLRYRLPIRVYDCVATAFNSSIGRVPPVDAEQHRQIERWLDRLGVASLGDRDFRTLSYGQQRRVLIARALVGSPRLLLLDEPGSGLDRSARKSLSLLLHEFAAAGGHIVLTSHRASVDDGPFTHTLRVDAGRLEPPRAV